MFSSLKALCKVSNGAGNFVPKFFLSFLKKIVFLFAGNHSHSFLYRKWR